MKKYNKLFAYLFAAMMVFAGCSDKENSGGGGGGGTGGGNGDDGGGSSEPVEEVQYDDTNCHYKSYNGLVMAGYQGWFTAEGDGADRGWHHYERNGQFRPGECTIDFWPDVSEYEKTYKTEFQYPNGDYAYVYSPIDESSVDLHFKWMQEYGIDGVFMQRFISEIKDPKGKAHFNKVLENALKAAKKYDRAICVMYDLSGSNTSNGDLEVLVNDWAELQQTYNLFDNTENPTYLWHNGRPMVTLWGVGFNDGRKYTVKDVDNIVEKIKGPTKKCSVMLGVPYYWRTGGNDTESGTAHSNLLSLIKKCDFIMPWAVGRYNESNVGVISLQIEQDITWCNENNVDYAPLCFPGFSWGNLQEKPELYDEIPRNGGLFLWKQLCLATGAGAKALYLAMFDEIDEGTALFKCARASELPLNGEAPWKFVGIEDNLPSDHYLWLAGQGKKLLTGELNPSASLPPR